MPGQAPPKGISPNRDAEAPERRRLVANDTAQRDLRLTFPGSGNTPEAARGTPRALCNYRLFPQSSPGEMRARLGAAFWAKTQLHFGRSEIAELSTVVVDVQQRP